ncbi:MAG TPA: Ig-like domain-containing protein [Patescibacteria group bacterium]|nr:Ig-like domain-containing protein [Patescibacteria group bacterium]
MPTGTTTQFHNIARYSDGTTRDVTSESTWSSSAPPFATVDAATGMVTAIKPGDLQINASYQNTNGSMRISVMPSASTPWSQLPPLSQAAKDFIVAHNLNLVFQGSEVGAVKRWNSFPIPIWADSNFRYLQDAINFWQTTTGGKVTFRIVANAAEANIVLDTQWPPPANEGGGLDACAGGNARTLVANVAISGSGHFGFMVRPDCNSEDFVRNSTAHEIGHILLLGGHTPTPDLMDPRASSWQASPLLVEVINWLYSVPPGTRPM